MIFSESWPGIFILLILALFIFHLFRNTNYKITDNQLYIKSGFIYQSKIDINQIKKISHTRSILSAPALSFDRLEILYNKFDSVIISPENKEEFVAELKKINPRIQITL